MIQLKNNSLFSLIFKILFVALNIGLVVVFRIYIKTKVFPNNAILKLVLGDIGSTLLNLIAILIMDYVNIFCI
jgi:hypothetical protein